MKSFFNRRRNLWFDFNESFQWDTSRKYKNEYDGKKIYEYKGNYRYNVITLSYRMEETVLKLFTITRI